MPRPETGVISTANSQALRNDDSLQRVANPTAGQQPTLGWIPQGRDLALEQVILGTNPVAHRLHHGSRRRSKSAIRRTRRRPPPFTSQPDAAAQTRARAVKSTGKRAVSAALTAGNLSVKAVPLPDRAFDADSPVMGFDHVAAEGQPQAGAPLAAGVGTALGREEAIEDPRQFVGRNAAAACRGPSGRPCRAAASWLQADQIT